MTTVANQTPSSHEEVLDLFRRAAWEIDQKKLDDLTLKDKISDLGIDSVALLEVIGFFEEELDIHLPDEKLSRVETVSDLAKLIVSLRQAT